MWSRWGVPGSPTDRGQIVAYIGPRQELDGAYLVGEEDVCPRDVVVSVARMARGHAQHRHGQQAGGHRRAQQGCGDAPVTDGVGGWVDAAVTRGVGLAQAWVLGDRLDECLHGAQTVFIQHGGGGGAAGRVVHTRPQLHDVAGEVEGRERTAVAPVLFNPEAELFHCRVRHGAAVAGQVEQRVVADVEVAQGGVDADGVRDRLHGRHVVLEGSVLRRLVPREKI